MTPTGKPYITSRGRKYKDQEHRLETTFGEGDYILVVDAKEEGLMASEKDEGREFRELLLKSMQELSRKIKEMEKILPQTRDRVKPQGVFASEKGPTLPTNCRSNSQLLPHVPRCPHF